MAMTFDAYLMVDWSARAEPQMGENSIWWGLARRQKGSTEVAEPYNPPTRCMAAGGIWKTLVDLMMSKQTVLVGFDFPYGYPAGFARALGLHGARWLAVWRELGRSVRDGARNENDRFGIAASLNKRVSGGAAPFWACPEGQAWEYLTPTRDFDFPVAGLREYRVTESRIRGPQSAWKLFGIGSVGSQALLGIPYVHALRFDPELRSVSRVWPFDTGFCLPERRPGEAMIVHAEIWPGIVDCDGEDHDINDARQVMALARHFAELDSKGDLGPLFGPPIGLTRSELTTAEREEGWILGVQ